MYSSGKKSNKQPLLTLKQIIIEEIYWCHMIANLFLNDAFWRVQLWKINIFQWKFYQSSQLSPNKPHMRQLIFAAKVCHVSPN